MKTTCLTGICTDLAGPAPSAPKSGRIEHIELHATYFLHKPQTWTEQWRINDVVDCPGLDAAADFVVTAVSVTDLNGDGKAEVTIPYKLFCGGGVDVSTVKIILREGPLKLAIRGESEVRIAGEAPFGGKHDYDKLLLSPAYASYKAHLDRVWTVVAPDRSR